MSSDEEAAGAGQGRAKAAEELAEEKHARYLERIRPEFGQLPFPRVWEPKLPGVYNRKTYRRWKARQTPESWAEHLAKQRAWRYAHKLAGLQKQWEKSQTRRAKRRAERRKLWDELDLTAMLRREQEVLKPREIPEPRARRFRQPRVTMDPEERRLRTNAAARAKRAAARGPPVYKPPKLKFCNCVQCAIRQRTGAEIQYNCSVFKCPAKFSDLVALCEHQLSAHGVVIPHARRIIAELYHQERATVPYPPPTVYAGQQFLYPNVRPAAWTVMERVERENQTLQGKLQECTGTKPQELVWKSFQAGYARIKQGGGLAELQLQYRLALAHYNSSLAFPVANRRFQDGMPAVAPGRNWLTSTEREEVTRATALRLGKADDSDDEDEIVLIDSEQDAAPSNTSAPTRTRTNASWRATKPAPQTPKR